MNKHDLVFMKKFAEVIAILFGIMVFLIFLGRYIYANKVPQATDAQIATVEERIAPVGAVIAGEGGKEMLAQMQADALAALKANVPFGGSTDGKVIYDGLCGACHNTGAGGAPMMTKAAWGGRVAQGVDTLVKHATEGFTGKSGVMPARGGNPALTDEQVKNTVQWMVDNLK